MLNREDILGTELPTRTVEVPEWGGTVYLRTMTGTDRDAFDVESVLVKNGEPERNAKNFRARLLVKCLCDVSGCRLFADDDAALLGHKNSAVLDRLFDVAAEMNGLTKAAVEEMAGN